jgi:hypothetical protein
MIMSSSFVVVHAHGFSQHVVTICTTTNRHTLLKAVANNDQILEIVDLLTEHFAFRASKFAPIVDQHASNICSTLVARMAAM